MQIPEKQFMEFLCKNGYKLTRERKEVLSCIVSFDGHFDPEILFCRLKDNGKKVSRASVYRSIPILISSGMIREALRDKGGVKYEFAEGKSHHDHMECIACGKVIEFLNEEIERLQETVSKKYGFTLMEHHLKLRGTCRECSGTP